MATERITNVHWLGRFREGDPVGEIFLDLGPGGSRGYLKAEAFVDPQFPEHITVRVDDFSNKLTPDRLPRIRLLVNGNTFADVPFYQPHDV